MHTSVHHRGQVSPPRAPQLQHAELGPEDVALTVAPGWFSQKASCGSCYGGFRMATWTRKVCQTMARTLKKKDTRPLLYILLGVQEEAVCYI